MNMNMRMHDSKLSLATAAMAVLGMAISAPSFGQGFPDIVVSQDGELVYSAAWSPDGSQLAYLGNATEGNQASLYVVNPDGTDHQLLLANDGTSYVVASGRIAWGDSGIYVVYETPATGREVYRIQSDGSGLTPITDIPDSSQELPQKDLSITADGSTLAFVGFGSSGWQDVYSVGADGTGRCRINPGSGHTDDLCLTADGFNILYATGNDHHTPHTIYMDDLPCGGNANPWLPGLSLGSYLEYFISPDESKIVYTAGSLGARTLVVCDSGGLNCVDIVEDGDNFFNKTSLNIYDFNNLESREVWTADSSRFFFSRNPGDGSYDIYNVASDGSGMVQVTCIADADEYQALLSPDGTMLAYIREAGEVRELVVRSAIVQDFDGDGVSDDCDDDIDDDSVPNEDDVCNYTPLGANVILDPESPLYGTIVGDLDGDCDCDLEDFAILQADFTGPNGL